MTDIFVHKEMTLRLLVLAHRVPFPPNKGEKLRTYHQLEYLLNRGHGVEVLCPYDNDDDKAYIESLSQHFAIATSGAKLHPRCLSYIQGFTQGKPLSVSHFYSTALQTVFDQRLSESQPDALLLTASSMAEYVFNSQAFSQREKPPRVVMDFMDLDSDKWLQYAESANAVMKWVYRREAQLIHEYEVKSAELFQQCFFVAQQEADLFIKNNPAFDNVSAVENGIDSTAFYPPPQLRAVTDAPVLLFTGVMDYAPNIDAVIWFVEEVWQQVLGLYPKARFVIAGMNPAPQVSALDGRDGIEVTGFVEDILPYFHQAHVFVAPFRLARGVQNKVLQAMATGLPVVTTLKGLEGIDAEAGVHLVTAESPPEFVDAIYQLLDKPEAFSVVAQQAEQKISERYSWEGALNNFESLVFGSESKHETNG